MTKPSDVVRNYMQEDGDEATNLMLTNIAQELDALMAGPAFVLNDTIIQQKPPLGRHGNWHRRYYDSVFCIDCGLESDEWENKDCTRPPNVSRSVPPFAITATVAPAVDEKLRDKIRLAIADDDPGEYPYHDGKEPITYGLSNTSIDRIADIAAQVVAAQPPRATIDGADTARLDWLESHHTDIFYLTSRGFFVYDKSNREEIAHQTAREAIDAAVQQKARTDS